MHYRYAIILFSTVFLHSGLNANAQSITPSIINATGGTLPIAGNIFDWSVGEMTMVSTFTSSSIIVTQGVLQPDSLRPVRTENMSSIENLSVYPNPANEIVIISFASQETGKLSYSLIDMSGKILTHDTRSATGNALTQQLSISRFSQGDYILDISFTSNSGEIKSSIYKIQKL